MRPIATELVISGKFSNINSAHKSLSNLFGLSFVDLHKIIPNIIGLNSAFEYSIENEYAISLLSLIAYQNDISKVSAFSLTFKELIEIIIEDLSDGIFDGREHDKLLSISNGIKSLSLGDIPINISKAGYRSLKLKNPILLNKMEQYFFSAAKASRAIPPPIANIKSSNHFRLNEKLVLSSEGSISPFGYPLTYTWSIISSPNGANAIISNPNDEHTYLTVDTEGIYLVSLMVSDGENSNAKCITITADIDGDGLLMDEDLDLDGDGILNSQDKFPDDISEFIDSDENGKGNFIQLDEDGDGVLDMFDDFPFDNAKAKLTVFKEKEFNGNLNDANALIGTFPYKISGSIYADGSDDDYFTFYSSAGSIVSIKLDKTNEIFCPIISIVDNNGNSLPSINNILEINTMVLTFRIPIEGNYYLIITDKNSYSDDQNNYFAKIFLDDDMDGVSNVYERAIGSNEYSSDTDSDTIKDYYEIFTNSLDIDEDGIPNWLDSDSDGDTILDKNETLTDYDYDGLLNPFDNDSDGNYISDDLEFGDVPNKATDTDGDNIDDFIDMDDDNDCILDLYDNNRLIAADINNSSEITLYGVFPNIDEGLSDYNILNASLSGGVLHIFGMNFSSKAIVILVNANEVYNLTPTYTNHTNITVELPKIEGRTEIKIFDKNELSISGQLTIYDESNPIITNIVYQNDQNYALENEVITIKGFNLANVTSVKINDISLNILSSTDTSLDFIVKNGIKSGNIVTSSTYGDSNEIYIFIGKMLTGTVNLPKGTSLQYSDLTIESSGLEFPINDDGSFSVIGRNNEITSITIYTPEDSNFKTSVYLSKLVYSKDDTNNVIVDINSTAIDIISSTLKVDETEQIEEILNIIKSNIDDFATELNFGIGANPYYLSEMPNSYYDNLNQTKNKIIEELSTQKSIQTKSINVGETVDDEGRWTDLEGFRVKKLGNPINGKIEIYNDTMLYSSYRVTNRNNNKIVKDYEKSVFNGMANGSILSSQDSSFYLYRAYSTIFDTKFRTSDVEIITPSLPTGFNNVDWSSLETKLFFLTIINNIIMPHTVSSIAGRIGNKKIQDIIIASLVTQIFIPMMTDPKIIGHLGNAVTYMNELTLMDLNILYNLYLSKPFTVSVDRLILKNKIEKNILSLLSNPEAYTKAKNEFDKARKAMYEYYFSKVGEVLSGDPLKSNLLKNGIKFTNSMVNEILAKMSIKFGIKGVPIAGKVYLALNEFNAFVDDAFILWDYIFTRRKVTFLVNFPIEIEKIYPTSVLKGRKTTIYIEGRGLEDILDTNDFLNSYNLYHPKVIMEYTENGKKFEDHLHCKEKNKNLCFFILPKDFIDNANESISIKVTHKHLDIQGINEFVDITVDAPEAIDIVDKLTITSLSPNYGLSNSIISIFGAGFSKNKLVNSVYFKTSTGIMTGTVLESYESKLDVQVPQNTITGDVWVEVDNDISNKLHFNILSAQLSIEFGDNGGSVDDIFSLDFNGGSIVKTTPHPVSRDSVTVEMIAGIIYIVKLTGISAPDSVGTYYISFPPKIEVLSGSDSQSGKDLIAGTVKTFYIVLTSTETKKNK